MRYTGAVTKKLKRFNLLPEAAPEQGGYSRNRKSEYGVRLEEKQKLRFIYGVGEKQFQRYFVQAQKDPQNTGIVLMQQLETRLDNAVYKLGFTTTRPAARQLVNHGHVLVNGTKVDIPSYNIKAGDEISLQERSMTIPSVVESLNVSKEETLPTWLERQGPVGRMHHMPTADELRDDIDLQLIIEYYSR